MALLRKILSATLIETLVATVLIVVVFMVASLILNNLLVNSFSKNTHAIENRMYELEYQYRQSTISLPYKEESGKWHIGMQTELSDGKIWVTIIATNNENNKIVTKSRICTIQN